MSSFTRQRTPRVPAHSHVENFRLTLAVLAGVAIAALAIAAALLIRDTRDGSSAPVASARWPGFKPNAAGNAGAQEIANNLGAAYRLTTAAPMASITSVSTTQLDQSSDTFTGGGLTVAITGGSTSGSDLSAAPGLSPLPGKVFAYDMCGTGGASCALGVRTTKPLILFARREALEIALYTFKYLHNAKYVVVLLPRGLAVGRGAASVTEAVLFERKQVSSLLTQPLTNTLTTEPPTPAELSTWYSGQEAGVVDELTSQSLYAAKVVNSQQDQVTLLQLSALPAQ